MPRLLILLLLLVCMHYKAISQNTYKAGVQPQVNFNVSMGDWEVNTQLKSRQILSQGEFGGVRNPGLVNERNDLETVISRETGIYNVLSAGYMIRYEGSTFYHRTIQQFSRVIPYGALRLGHRVAMDQTFANGEAPEYRLRYRISAELPLNGQRVDPGEFYVKLNCEGLLSLTRAEADLEVRGLGMLGYKATKTMRWEAGLDYRAAALLQDYQRQQYWLNMALYISI